jgi:hypothetical protein
MRFRDHSLFLPPSSFALISLAFGTHDYIWQIQTFQGRSRKINAIYKRKMVLVCHQNRNGSTRVITNTRGGHPPLVLEGDHLGLPTLHPPHKGEYCFRWYVTTPRWSMHPDDEGLHRLKRMMFTFRVHLFAPITSLYH